MINLALESIATSGVVQQRQSEWTFLEAKARA